MPCARTRWVLILIALLLLALRLAVGVWQRHDQDFVNSYWIQIVLGLAAAILLFRHDGKLQPRHRRAARGARFATRMIRARRGWLAASAAYRRWRYQSKRSPDNLNRRLALRACVSVTVPTRAVVRILFELCICTCPSGQPVRLPHRKELVRVYANVRHRSSLSPAAIRRTSSTAIPLAWM
jgi:hypothetical protein